MKICETIYLRRKIKMLQDDINRDKADLELTYVKSKRARIEEKITLKEKQMDQLRDHLSLMMPKRKIPKHPYQFFDGSFAAR